MAGSEWQCGTSAVRRRGDFYQAASSGWFFLLEALFPPLCWCFSNSFKSLAFNGQMLIKVPMGDPCFFLNMFFLFSVEKRTWIEWWTRLEPVSRSQNGSAHDWICAVIMGVKKHDQQSAGRKWESGLIDLQKRFSKESYHFWIDFFSADALEMEKTC